MARILQKMLTNSITMKSFRKLIQWVKNKFKKNELMHVDVPMTCKSSAEKRKIIKATKVLLEQNIIII